MVAILDGRFAADRIAHKVESTSVFVFSVSLEIEHCSIVRASQVPVEPTMQFLTGPHFRDAFVLDRSENGAADQNLPACIALPFVSRGTSNESALLSANSRESFIERLNS